MRDTPEGWGGYSARWLQPPPPYSLPPYRGIQYYDRQGVSRRYGGTVGMGGGITSREAVVPLPPASPVYLPPDRSPGNQYTG